MNLRIAAIRIVAQFPIFVKRPRFRGIRLSHGFPTLNIRAAFRQREVKSKFTV